MSFVNEDPVLRRKRWEIEDSGRGITDIAKHMATLPERLLSIQVQEAIRAIQGLTSGEAIELLQAGIREELETQAQVDQKGFRGFSYSRVRSIRHALLDVKPRVPPHVNDTRIKALRALLGYIERIEGEGGS